MPEPYWPKRKGSYTLTDAARNGRFARMRCRYCKIEKFYLIEELRVAFGNVECDDLVFMRGWRCSQCGKRDTAEMKFEEPPAADRQSVKLRRIDRIEYVRRVIWRDE